MHALQDLLNSTGLRVLAYLAAAAFALFAGRRSLAPARARHDWGIPAFWAVAFTLLAALALARFLDFGSQLADVGRSVFRTEGWYPDRRPIQREAIAVLLALAAVASFGGSALLISKRWASVLPAFISLVGLLTFVSVRAVSFHNIDALLYRRSVMHVSVSAIAELAATLAVALAAALAALVPAVAESRASGRRFRRG